MTITHVETSYLETSYLGDPYLVNNVDGYMGQQTTFTIEARKTLGMQCTILIVDRPISQGQQAKFTIANKPGARGQQAKFTIDSSKALGQQAFISLGVTPAQGHQTDISIGNALSYGQQASFAPENSKVLGQQAKFSIANYLQAQGQQAQINLAASPPKGMQYKRDNIAHLECEGYLGGNYLEDAYLASDVCAHGAHQAFFRVVFDETVGQQALFTINAVNSYGQQALFTINAANSYGQQALINLSKTPAQGQQAQINIVDRMVAQGQQAKITIVDFLDAFGMNVQIIQQFAIGMQARFVLYNTDHLRILCSFPSRGAAGAVGLNAWGFPAGQGQSWTSNSIEAGDFSPFNLNTDIVEQTYRSNAPTVSGINLDCDTERAQGVFVDTFAMLNHNITSSATVNLLGSNTSNFSVIGVTIPLEIRSDDPNVYWISPELPNTGYRYWRVSIDDSSNPDGYVEIGTIIFGASSIFFGECFVDQVEFQLRDYTDSVQTEGFTNVNNSRAQKKVLRLEFRSLSYLKSNFRLMRDMFRRERTVLKCLWIPTPDPDNQEYSSRFAVFSKLAQIPVESHNHKGGDADYVTFNIELDESR